MTAEKNTLNDEVTCEMLTLPSPHDDKCTTGGGCAVENHQNPCPGYLRHSSGQFVTQRSKVRRSLHCNVEDEMSHMVTKWTQTAMICIVTQ